MKDIIPGQDTSEKCQPVSSVTARTHSPRKVLIFFYKEFSNYNTVPENFFLQEFRGVKNTNTE